MSASGTAGETEQNLPFLEIVSKLTRHSDVGEFVNAALDGAIQSTRCQGGSLVLAGDPPRGVRTGEVPSEVDEQISRWEDALLDRLRMSPWEIGDTENLPVSTHTVQSTQHLLTSIPLLHRGRVTGSLTLVFPPGHVLSLSQRQILTWCARGVGNLAGMIQQLTTTQHGLNQLSFLHETSQALTSTLDLREVLDNTMELATEILDASASTLMLIDEETSELVFDIPHGEKRELLRSYRMAMDRGIAGWVATQGQPAIVNDTTQDRRFSREADARTGFLTESVICVPLQIKDRTIGVLEVLNKMSREGFTQDDLRLLSTLAAQAAIAIENARLYRSLREERDKIIRVEEEARRELARDLHDGTLQTLSSISMNIDYIKRLLEHEPLSAIAELDRLQETVVQASREARTLLFQLRPIVLETRGLVRALEAFVEQLQAEESPSFHFHDGGFDGRLANGVEITAFMIVQEAVTNARKHAKPENVWLNVTTDETHLRIVVEDDGQGFDLEAAQASTKQDAHLGLVNMQERAGMIDARLTVQSRPDHGTKIVLQVPLSSLQDQSRESRAST